jgi:hypothetical protein
MKKMLLEKNVIGVSARGGWDAYQCRHAIPYGAYVDQYNMINQVKVKDNMFLLIK